MVWSVNDNHRQINDTQMACVCWRILRMMSDADVYEIKDSLEERD